MKHRVKNCLIIIEYHSMTIQNELNHYILKIRHVQLHSKIIFKDIYSLSQWWNTGGLQEVAKRWRHSDDVHNTRKSDN